MLELASLLVSYSTLALAVYFGKKAAKAASIVGFGEWEATLQLTETLQSPQPAGVA